MNVKEELNELIHKGVLKVVLQADTAYLLLRGIGEHAAQINKAGFGSFFWTVQNSLVDQFILSLAKLFEEQKKNYPVRSLPAIRDFITKHSNELHFGDRRFVLDLFVEIGRSVPAGAKDEIVTARLLEYLASRLPAKTGGDSLTWGYLQSLKARRDKQIAHNEHVDADAVASGTWKEALELLNLAKDLVHVIARGYLNLHCKNGAEYLLGRDAQRVQTCLTRLLKTAGIAPIAQRVVTE